MGSGRGASPLREISCGAFPEKMRDFHRRFLSRFPSLVCRDLKPQAPDFQAGDPDLRGLKPCSVYIAAAVELLEEMLSEEA